MMDERLARLNFHQLLHYGGQPPVRNLYSPPLQCGGYCLSCENAGLLTNSGWRLDRMSHGCTTNDFEEVLGPMPCEGKGIVEPVLFLLEQPSATSDNGVPVNYQGFYKQPPINRYYWAPSSQTWPSSLNELNGNFYGNYFAYLMRQHKLRNVYITNLIKCGWIQDSGNVIRAKEPADVAMHCMDRYLDKEFQIFRPRIAFCFGKKTEQGLRKFLQRDTRDCEIVLLAHPSAIKLARRHHKTPEQMVDDNNHRIVEVTAGLRR